MEAQQRWCTMQWPTRGSHMPSSRRASPAVCFRSYQIRSRRAGDFPPGITNGVRSSCYSTTSSINATLLAELPDSRMTRHYHSAPAAPGNSCMGRNHALLQHTVACFSSSAFLTALHAAIGVAGGCGSGDCCDGGGGTEACGGDVSVPGHLEFPLEAAEVVSASDGSSFKRLGAQTNIINGSAAQKRPTFQTTFKTCVMIISAVIQVLEAILHPASVMDGSAIPGAVDLGSVPVSVSCRANPVAPAHRNAAPANNCRAQLCAARSVLPASAFVRLQQLVIQSAAFCRRQQRKRLRQPVQASNTLWRSCKARVFWYPLEASV